MEATLRLRSGRYIHDIPIEYEVVGSKIEITRQPFNLALNAEWKAMRGYHWHGFDDESPRKIWSVENHPRNVFQLKRLMGEKVYAWWEQPLIELTEDDFNRPEYAEYGVTIQAQQIDMIRRILTHHYVILAAEQGLGKSLVGIEVAERVGGLWWFVGSLGSQKSVRLELKKWNSQANFDMLTYDGLVKRMRYDINNLMIPRGIIFDESTNVKTPTTHRARESQKAADMVRTEHGFNGFVVLFSGTPTAKHPTDIWSQAEVAWPGFLREGSFFAFENRYAIMDEVKDMDGVAHTTKIGYHEHEVAKLHERLSGLMTVYRKKDWIDLPDKKYVVERVKPSKKIERVARGLVHVAPNAMSALHWTRSLSDGFQYKIEQKGFKQCQVCDGTGTYDKPVEAICPGCDGSGQVPKYERKTVYCDCPKDNVLRKWLDKCDDHGRIVIACGFQGSVDRVLAICRERGWGCVAVDGRGWRYYDLMGKQIKESKVDPLDTWETATHKVAFVGNPGSCRFGLTLTKAHTMVFFDNDFSAEYRLQMQDRIHRIGMDEIHGATIVDIIHLPVDQLVLDTLNENKRLESLSLGLISDSFGEGEMEIIDPASQPLEVESNAS